MTISIIDSYGYGALLGGVVAYHLFPDFVGGKNEAMHHQGLETGKLTVSEIMKLKGNDTFIAGSEASIADFYLAPNRRLCHDDTSQRRVSGLARHEGLVGQGLGPAELHGDAALSRELPNGW